MKICRKGGDVMETVGGCDLRGHVWRLWFRILAPNPAFSGVGPETTMTLQWIAEILCMGSWAYVSILLRPNADAQNCVKDKTDP